MAWSTATSFWECPAKYISLDFLNHNVSMSELSPVWRGLPDELTMLVLDHTDDRATMKNWSCVNQLFGGKAKRHLWKTFRVRIDRNTRGTTFFNWGKLDVLARNYNCGTIATVDHPLPKATQSIKELQVTLGMAGGVVFPFSPPSPPWRAQDFYVDEILSSMQDVRDLCVNGHVTQSVLEWLLGVGNLETVRIHGLRFDPDDVRFELLATHQNLRMLDISQFLLSEAHGLAITVRTLRLSILCLTTGQQPGTQRIISPLGAFLTALMDDSHDSDSGGDWSRLRCGFPVTMKELVLHDNQSYR